MNKERIITVAIILSLLATTVACNKTAEGYFNSGNTKYDQKDFKGAIQDHNKAIELNPSDAEAYSARGLEKLSLGQKDNGCLDFSKAGEMGYLEAYEAIKGNCN